MISGSPSVAAVIEQMITEKNKKTAYMSKKVIKQQDIDTYLGKERAKYGSQKKNSVTLTEKNSGRSVKPRMINAFTIFIQIAPLLVEENEKEYQSR